MTSETAAPAAGAADAPGVLLPDGPTEVWVVLGVGSEWLPVVCEQPATSTDAAIIAAIRIQSG
ncbi:hypothetical protein W7U_07370 [Mycobacterium sp. H4Y]|nr:hypothetical protein W7U_07370 [Mycobacterium sp. H4Y]